MADSITLPIVKGMQATWDGLIPDPNKIYITTDTKRIYLGSILLAENWVAANPLINVTQVNDIITFTFLDATTKTISLSGKLDKYQGTSNEGKYAKVGTDGNYTNSNITAEEVTYYKENPFTHVIDETNIQDEIDYIRTSTNADVINALLVHNTSDSAHADIRTEISTKQTVAQVATAISTHNTSSTAHQDIRDLITNFDCVENVEYDDDTGDVIFTFTDETTLTINIWTADLMKDLDYDNSTKELVIIKEDLTEIRVPVSDLITEYVGSNNTNIQITIGTGNVINATLKTGTVTKAQLHTDLQAEIEGKVDIDQGAINEGKILKINLTGEVDLANETIITCNLNSPPDTLGEIGQYCITPTAIYKKELYISGGGFNLISTGVGMDVDGFYEDMGVNTTIAMNGGNPNGTHWYFNEPKHMVLTWNTSYSNYWWISQVNSPYSPSDIEYAKTKDNGSASFYCGSGATQPADNTVTPPNVPNTSGGASWSNLGSSATWTYQPSSGGVEVERWVLFSAWKVDTVNGRIQVGNSALAKLSEVVSSISNGGNMSISGPYTNSDGSRYYQISPQVSSSYNNALTTYSGLYAPAERLNYSALSVTATTYAWNMTSYPFCQLTYTGTGTGLTITESHNLLSSSYGIRGKMMLIQGNAAGTIKTLTISPSTIKWARAPLTQMIGGNTYLIEIWVQNTVLYGDWEIMDNKDDTSGGGDLSNVVKTGTDLIGTSPVTHLYNAPNLTTAETLSLTNPNKAFVFPFSITPATVKYTTCTTVGSSAAKQVSAITGLNLVDGNLLAVRFVNKNTSIGALTFEIGTSGPKKLYYGLMQITNVKNVWSNNSDLILQYDVSLDSGAGGWRIIYLPPMYETVDLNPSVDTLLTGQTYYSYGGTSEYATITYVDGLIGDINTILDAINGEVI